MMSVTPKDGHTPTLYLVPNGLSQDVQERVQLLYQNQILTPWVVEKILQLDFWLVENAKDARAFLKAVANAHHKNLAKPLADMTMLEMARTESYGTFFAQAAAQQADIGVLSDAGVPCIADPGAQVVQYANQLKWPVMPMVGPSSILLALMASGLTGQQFTFHGYLPIVSSERAQAIRDTQMGAAQGYTHLCIETPYRNIAMLQSLLEILPKDMRLCVAQNMTCHNMNIRTLPIHVWKKTLSDEYIQDLHKTPTIFLWG